MAWQRKDRRFLIALCIAIPLALLTSFKNQLSIDLTRADAERVLVKVQSHSDIFETSIVFNQPHKLYGTFQHSMAGRSYISALQVIDSNRKFNLVDASGVYLFGSGWGRGFFTAEPSNFTPSFGDWTIDRFESNPRLISQIDLNLPLHIDLTVLGRGTNNLILMDDKSNQIKISLNDGFIDNAVSVCEENNCPGGGLSNESQLENFARILNVAAEGIVFSGIIWITLLFLKPLSRCTRLEIPQAGKQIMIAVLVILHVTSVYFFANNILGSIPHIPDAAIYVRQAILLGHGMLSAPLPPAMPYEAFLSNSSLLENSSIVYRHASYFWPLFLAIFARTHLLYLVNPLLALISITCLAYLVKTHWSLDHAVLTILIYCLSPFVLVNFGDFMMHGFCLTLALISISCITHYHKVKDIKWCAFAGFFAAYCFGARQITAISLGVPLFISWCWYLYRNKELAAIKRFLIGAIPCAVMFLVNNYIVIGSFFGSIYTQVHGLKLSVENLPMGLNMSDSMLGYLNSILLPSLIPGFTIGIAIFGLLAHWSKLNVTMALLFLSLFFAHFFINTNGLHGYGPRFLFEATPAILILVAAGLLEIFHRTKIFGGVLVSLYVALAITRLFQILPTYRNYNQVDQPTFNSVANLDPTKSIVLTHGSSWQKMDTYATLFDPTWNGLLVIHALEDGSHQQVINALPNREVHEVN